MCAPPTSTEKSISPLKSCLNEYEPRAYFQNVTIFIVFKSKFSNLNIFVIKRKKGDTEEKEEEHIDDNMKEMEDIQEENQEKKTVETEQTEDDHKDEERGEPDGSKDSKEQVMVSSLICNP